MLDIETCYTSITCLSTRLEFEELLKFKKLQSKKCIM